MMPSRSSVRKRGSDRGDYGFARVRDLAFDAVVSLWRKRRSAGMKQSDIAAILNRDPGWVSKQFRGPGNWTLRTIGELIEAMNGEFEITAYGLEEKVSPSRNFDAYSGYGAVTSNPIVTTGGTQTIYLTTPIRTQVITPVARTLSPIVELVH